MTTRYASIDLGNGKTYTPVMDTLSNINYELYLHGHYIGEAPDTSAAKVILDEAAYDFERGRFAASFVDPEQTEAAAVNGDTITPGASLRTPAQDTATFTAAATLSYDEQSKAIMRRSGDVWVKAQTPLETLAGGLTIVGTHDSDSTPLIAKLVGEDGDVACDMHGNVTVDWGGLYASDLKLANLNLAALGTLFHSGAIERLAEIAKLWDKPKGPLFDGLTPAERHATAMQLVAPALVDAPAAIPADVVTVREARSNDGSSNWLEYAVGDVYVSIEDLHVSIHSDNQFDIPDSLDFRKAPGLDALHALSFILEHPDIRRLIGRDAVVQPVACAVRIQQHVCDDDSDEFEGKEIGTSFFAGATELYIPDPTFNPYNVPFVYTNTKPSSHDDVNIPLDRFSVVAADVAAITAHPQAKHALIRHSAGLPAQRRAA